MKTLKRPMKIVIQSAPLIMIGVMAYIYLTKLRGLTLTQLLEYTPENTIAAALVILGMYGLKSLSFFFPMMLIAALAGAVLPIKAALAVNLLGILVMATLPYLIGRYAEVELVDSIASKHPKVSIVRDFGKEHELSSSFFLRIISCLPYDVVSLVLGSIKISYGKYLLGTFLGTAPGFILTTFMGEAVSDPLSHQFLICAGANASISIISFILWRKASSSRKSSL